MALATNSSPGEIQLAGDLAGNNDATAPELTSTAVTPGSYSIPDITVDGKGRITSAANGDIATIKSTIGDATTSSKGLVQIGSNVDVASGVISVADADGTTTKGVIKSGDSDYFVISAGVLTSGPLLLTTTTENTFTKGQHTTTVALTSSGSPSVVAFDASAGNVFTLTLTENTELSNPTNLEAGDYTFIVTQDATSAKTLSFGSTFKFKAGAGTAVSSELSSKTIISCISDGTNMFCSVAKGFE